MNIRKMLIIAASAFLLLSSSNKEVIYITNGEWLPYLSENLEEYGFVSQIVSESFALEDIEVRYMFRPWTRAFEEARIGKFNGSLVWRSTPEREADFYFSEPVLIGETVFFHLKSLKFDWKSYEDLLTYRIGGAKGYTYTFQSHPDISIEYAANEQQNLKKLLARRIDLFPSDLEVGYAFLYHYFPSTETEMVTHHKKAFEITEYHLILSKRISDNKRYLALFNRGLKKLRESGRYDEIVKLHRKWKE